MRKPCAWLLFISSLFFFFFYKLKKERLFFFRFACAFAEGDEVPDFAVSAFELTQTLNTDSFVFPPSRVLFFTCESRNRDHFSFFILLGVIGVKKSAA